jgi:hypothetical protein
LVDAWPVEVAIEVTIVEDRLLDKVEVSSNFVDVLDGDVWVDCKELEDAIEELLAGIEVLEVLENMVEVVELAVELACVVIVVVTVNADGDAGELVVSSLSLNVVWYAMTAGALVSWQL